MQGRWICILLLCSLLRAAVANPQPWFRQALVGIEVGPTGAHFGHSDTNDLRYSAQFDGREIVRRCVAANSEYLVMWARDGDYAYYNSRILLKAPGLRDRDPLREAVEEARQHKLPIIAYCVVQQGGHFLKAHPEWEMRGFDGKPLNRYCFNSGYLEAMKSILAEQLEYGIDGFHIDMVDQGFGKPHGCWCDRCKELFRREYHIEMPSEPTWDEAWDKVLAFRYRAGERIQKELFAHVKKLNPRVTVDFNYHGNPPFFWPTGQLPVEHANNADFVTGETGVWGFSALTVALNAEFYRAATPGIPYQVAMQRGVRMYHDQTTRPLADLRWELLTLLAHGAFVTMVDKTAFDGWLDPLAYERIRAAFADARARRRHFGQTPLQDVAIYFSSRTRDWMGRENPNEYFQAFQGAHKALAYEHIPWGIALDENATLDYLQRFPVLLLPNVSILSAEEFERLRAYVENGGNLIVTGFAGTHDRLGLPLKESGLADLVGARVVTRLETFDNWVRFKASDPLRGQTRADWPFLVKGPAVVWNPASAEPIGELWKPVRTSRQLARIETNDWPMSADSPVGPAALLNKIGKGKVLTFACSPDFASGSEHHIVEARRLLAEGIRHLHPEPRVTIKAPPNVETVITDDPATRTLRVHLLGYNSAPQTTPPRGRPNVLPMPIEDPPLFRAGIRLKTPIKDVTLFGNSTSRVVEDRIEVMVEDVHEVVAITY